MDVYKSKDELIDNYALTGKFSNEKHEEFPLTVKPRRIYSLINTVCLNLLVVPAFLGHIGILAFSGSSFIGISSGCYFVHWTQKIYWSHKNKQRFSLWSKTKVI